MAMKTLGDESRSNVSTLLSAEKDRQGAEQSGKGKAGVRDNDKHREKKKNHRARNEPA